MSRFGYTSLGFGSGASAAAAPFANTKSVDCDGTDFYGIGNHSDLDLEGNFTMSCWFKADAIGSVDALVSWGNGALGQVRGLIFYLGKLTVNTYGYSLHHGTTPPTDTWTHAACTFDNSSPANVLVYMNGTSTTPVSGTLTVNSFATFYGPWVAGSGIAGYTFYDGNIDEVGIWNKVLSGSQINDIYNSGSPGDLTDIESSNLKAWWRMGDGDNGSGTDDNIPSSGSGTVYDMSGNSNDLTLNNCDANPASTDVP